MNYRPRNPGHNSISMIGTGTYDISNERSLNKQYNDICFVSVYLVEVTEKLKNV